MIFRLELMLVYIDRLQSKFMTCMRSRASCSSYWGKSSLNCLIELGCTRSRIRLGEAHCHYMVIDFENAPLN